MHLLAENYRGYAEMANLVSSWLMASGLNSSQVSEMIKERLKALLMEKFSPSQADSIFAEMQSAPHWLDVMIEHPEWRALIYQVLNLLAHSVGTGFRANYFTVIGSASELFDVEFCNPEDIRCWPSDGNRLIGHSIY